MASGNTENNKRWSGTVEPVTPGEMYLSGSDASYNPFIFLDTPGKLELIIYFPARISVKHKVDMLRDHIASQGYAESDLSVVTIADFDRALWGTKGLAESELQRNKKSNPEVQVVRDDAGTVRAALQLGSVNLFLLLRSADGKFLYEHSGDLSDRNLEEIVSVIDKNIN